MLADFAVALCNFSISTFGGRGKPRACNWQRCDTPAKCACACRSEFIVRLHSVHSCKVCRDLHVRLVIKVTADSGATKPVDNISLRVSDAITAKTTQSKDYRIILQGILQENPFD